MPNGEAKRRGVSLSLVFVLLSAGILAATAMMPVKVRAATLYVGVGPGMYTTIQSAIDAAAPWDTVFVYKGVYRENININKAIAVVGEDRNLTVIDGRRSGRTVTLAASQASVSRLTITNGAPGIGVGSLNGCVIRENIVSDSTYGISLSNVLGMIIENNMVTANNYDGISLSSSNNNRITGNVVSSNGQNGIYLSSSVGNLIEGNVASSNEKGILLEQSSNNIVSNNIALSNYDTSNQYGAGIYLKYSSSNVVSGNNASSNYYSGIRLEQAANNEVTGNTASSNYIGFYIMYSSANYMENNLVSLNEYGIEMDFSNGNVITKSSVSSNMGYGVYMRSSGNNTLVDSSVASNDYRGIYLYLSSSNRLFHNNIVGNSEQAYDSGSNEWDDGYPSGGNYWSDYGGVDLKSGALQDIPGSDGIGDTLYYIPDGASVDHYPKAGPNVAPQSPPSQPLNLTTISGDAKATLNWEAPTSDGGSPITNYRIYRREEHGPMEFLLQIGNVLTYTDAGLMNGFEYFYWVSARNLVGEGLESNMMNATPATVPGAPLGLAAVAESRLITLTWMAPSNDGGAVVTNFRIYRGTNPGGESLLAEVGNVRQYLDIGLTNGQTYYYVLKAKNVVGEGAPSDEVSATPAAIITVPTPPVRLAAVAGDRQVILNWAAPVDNGGSPVANYSVYRGPFSGGEAFLVEIGSVFTYTDTGLSNGQTYFYRISAKNAMGEGAKSDSASAVPMTVPGPPIGLSANAGDRRVELAWLSPIDNGGSPVVHYTIYRGGSAGGETFLTVVGNVLAYLDTGLANGAKYHYVVSASNALGEGAESAEVNATPAAPPPNQLPFCSIVSPTQEASISERYSVVGTSSDADGTIEFVEVRVDGSGWTTAIGTTSWSFDLDTALYSNGRHTIYARSFDGEDYSGFSTVNIYVTNGEGPPSTGTDLLQQSWFWALLFMTVVTALLVVLYMRERLQRMKGREEVPRQAPRTKPPQAKPKAAPSKSAPPPPDVAPEHKENP